MGDQDKGYSSLEDSLEFNPRQAAEGGEQTPGMVIEAVLRRLRDRAGCQEESFVRRLNTRLLGRMARHVFRNWQSARNAVENGERTEMPDLMTLVTDELRIFGRRREISEEYDRRSSRESLVHCELEEQRRRERGDYVRSPRRRQSLTQSYEADPTLNLDLVQPVRYRTSPDSPISPATGASDFEAHRSYQRTEHVRFRRKSTSKSFDEESKREHRRMRHARKSLDNLQLSLSPRNTPKESPEDEQQEDSSTASAASSVQGAEGGVSPEDSSTPSDDLSASMEERKPDKVEVVPRSKEERAHKQTRRIIEGLSTRHLVSLRNQSISRMDALEMIIQLSVSLDHLDHLINWTKSSSVAEEFDMAALQQFYESLEIARNEEISNRDAATEADSNDAEQAPPSVPAVEEHPVLDPKADQD